MGTLYLCGAGNPEGVRLAQRINERQQRWERLVILDDDPSKHGRSVLGVEIAGPFVSLAEADPDTAEVVNLVARTTERRAAANAAIASFGVPFATLIHPSVDTLGAETGSGVLVYNNAILSPGSVVGDHSVVFAGALIGHGATVSSLCVVAAGAVLNARVRLDTKVYFGTNASVLPELTIGAGATIGSNSSVIEDVPAGATAIGVPAQVLAVGGGDRPETARREPMDQAKLEDTIRTIWADVLGLEDFDLESNFFDLGGTSQQALVVRERLREASALDIAVTDMYRFPTVVDLAARLSEQHGADASAGTHRRAARPETHRDAPAAPHEQPKTEVDTEAAICQVWRQLLGVAAVGPEDNFFELGGTSQLALVAREQIRGATGCQVSPTDVFKFPTAHALSERIRQRASLPSATTP